MKKNLAITLLIVTLSAIPLMAQIDLSKNDILRYSEAAKQQAVLETTKALANATYDDINKFVIHALKQDMESDLKNVEKYQNLTNKYKRFLSILQENDLTVEQTVNGKTEIVLSEYGEQRMYITLDDMAKAIKNLPAEKVSFYNTLIGKYNVYIFKTLDKVVNIAYLYDMSKDAISDNAKNNGYKSAISESPMVKETPYVGPIITNK